MAKTSYINVRVEEQDKINAEEILSDLGINVSTAIDMFLKQVIFKEGLPFDVKIHKPSYNEKRAELAAAINLTGGKTYPKRFKKLISLYANGDIDYEVALFAIKREYQNA